MALFTGIDMDRADGVKTGVAKSWAVWLRSSLFNLCFYGLTALMAVLFLPCLLWRGTQRQWLPKLWIRTALFLCRALCGLDYKVWGMENLPAGACIIAAKHQSAWETMALYLLIHKPCFILKKELLRIPLFGWYLQWVGAIPIDRSKGSDAIPAMLRSAQEHISQGYSIIIFPEGTRRPYRAAPAYRSGVRKLYEALHVPVVPVALNSGRYWARKAFKKYPGTIEVHFLPRLEPGMEGEAFLAMLESVIESRMQQL